MEYSFVDMHMHTRHSNEELCDITVLKTLEIAQKQAESLGKDCLISISDHNSMLGCLLAHKYIQEGKFPNVKFINGIEFTTDLTELNKNFDSNLFTRAHVLGYNFDEKNKELIAYSTITHLHFGQNDNVGLQICAARRIINEEFNVKIPFSVLLPLSEKAYDFRDEFVKIVSTYLNKYPKATSEYIDSLVEPYLSNHVSNISSSSSKGRLKLSEVFDIIKNAGGDVVLAHPSTLSIDTNGIQSILKAHDPNYKTRHSSSKRTILGNFREKEYILSFFLDTVEQSLGKNFDGLEVFYSENFAKNSFISFSKVCKEKGMYESCGSDYHGPKIFMDKKIGLCFHKNMTFKYQEYNPDDQKLAEDRVKLYISQIGIADKLTENKKNVETIIKDVSGRIVRHQDIENLIIHVKQANYGQPQSSQNTRNLDYDIPTTVDKCRKLAEKFKKLTKVKVKPGRRVITLSFIKDKVSTIMQILDYYKDFDLKNPNMLTNYEKQDIRVALHKAKKALSDVLKKFPNILNEYDEYYDTNKHTNMFRKFNEYSIFNLNSPEDVKNDEGR